MKGERLPRCRGNDRSATVKAMRTRPSSSSPWGLPFAGIAGALRLLPKRSSIAPVHSTLVSQPQSGPVNMASSCPGRGPTWPRGRVGPHGMSGRTPSGHFPTRIHSRPWMASSLFLPLSVTRESFPELTVTPRMRSLAKIRSSVLCQSKRHSTTTSPPFDVRTVFTAGRTELP